MLKEYKQYAYDDVPLPIGHDQTISQPSTVIFMTNALDVKKTDKILEIGTGSGYNSALIYDKIILTAASREAPRHLLKQLKENGILLAPVGNLYIQDMIKLTKDKTESLGKFVFVPLKGKYGFTQ